MYAQCTFTESCPPFAIAFQPWFLLPGKQYSRCDFALPNGSQKRQPETAKSRKRKKTWLIGRMDANVKVAEE